MPGFHDSTPPPLRKERTPAGIPALRRPWLAALAACWFETPMNAKSNHLHGVGSKTARTYSQVFVLYDPDYGMLFVPGCPQVRHG